jgi:hypothetical protein
MTKVSRMAQQIKREDWVGVSVARCTGTPESSSRGPLPSIADDNVCDGFWPLVPFPKGLLSAGGATPQRSQEGPRSSWKATSGKLAFAATAFVAMFGWLYLLWLAVVSSVEKILS